MVRKDPEKQNASMKVKRIIGQEVTAETHGLWLVAALQCIADITKAIVPKTPKL